MTDANRAHESATLDAARFAALARVHCASVAGEALVALALAGSLFFKVDPAEGREKVLLGLLLTIAPFGLVAPLIGPVIDRVPGGHRVVVATTLGTRVVLAMAMVVSIAQDSVALFPEAFAMLVLAKTYQVGKAALVPTVVSSDAELVQANSKLQVLSGITTMAAGAPGLVLSLIDPALVVGAAAVCFAVGAVASLRIAVVPDTDGLPVVGSTGETAGRSDEARELRERAELRSAAVVSAGVVMGALRGVVGLTTFLVAFELRGGTPSVTERAAVETMRVASTISLSGRYDVPAIGPPSWHFGVVVALGVLGGLAGAALAPRLRSIVTEERMLVGAAAFVALGAIIAAQFDGLAALSLLTLVVSVASSAAKQAFDALVQRDAPDADRGRLFARFEARFQLAWVVAALPPVAFSLPVGLGAVVAAVIAVLAVIVGLLGADRVNDALRTQGRAALGDLRARRNRGVTNDDRGPRND